jgi:queuine tRNA-ribosyltransferase subunit QTRTD1
LFRPSDGSPPLRRFIALPEPTLLVLGCRRTPPVIAPPKTSNTNTEIAVGTSVGFKLLKAEEYADAVEGLGVDIVLGLGDVPYGRTLGSKRIEKATDRSIDWLKDHVARRKKLAAQDGFKGQAQLFAPLLPLSCANQQYYVDCLVDDVRNDISGLAIYSADTLEDLPEELATLPRLDLTEPATPLAVLRQIANGVDIVTMPFISVITDAGIALDFEFPGPSTTPSEILPLGIDLWSSSHATDLSPLRGGCSCYACTDHHRAFLQHLLAAKEMLGWVLLQVHNHHMIDKFFASIRSSIAAGTFEADVETFSRCYDSELPEKTGQGPR